MRTIFMTPLLLLGLLPNPSRADNSPLLAIGLNKSFNHATRILVSSDAPFTLAETGSGNVIRRGEAGAVYEASGGDEGMVVTRIPMPDKDSSQGFSTAVTLTPDATGLVRVARIDRGAADIPHPNWHRYRGTLTIRPNPDGTLRLINTVPVESYLYGVVPAEIGAGAPEEALKAQAVAARTYALKNRNRFVSEGFDIDDTTRSESYLGVDGEFAGANAAVDKTAGQVLTYKGDLIDAVFSTDCGGMTACDVRGFAPYLQAVRDSPGDGEPDYTAKSKYHDWTQVYTASEMAALLSNGAESGVSQFDGLAIDGYDASGRVTTATVTCKDGTKHSVRGTRLRELLGPDRLRSTRFTLTVTPDGGYVFKGNGWGHGLGMCQLGAIAMAAAPYHKSYREILQHYYVGTEIGPLASVTPSHAPITGTATPHVAQPDAAPKSETTPPVQPAP